MKILAIETSGKVCGTALLDGDTLVAEYNAQYKKTHSQSLVPMMDEIKQMVGLELGTVDAIALTKGPGSFTGIRIGAATAKGLGLALDRPLIPVPTVDAIAYNLYGTGGLVCPIMDARRSQVYTGTYEFTEAESGKTSVMRTIRPQCVISIEETVDALNELNSDVIFPGDGVPVYRDRIAEMAEFGYSFAPSHLALQRAAATAELAMQYWKESGDKCFVDADSFRPEYLRVSQAERERAEGIDTSKVVKRGITNQ